MQIWKTRSQKLTFFLCHEQASFSKTFFVKVLQNLQQNTCARVSFQIKLQAEVCNFIEKESHAQVFSCAFCESFKKCFFIKHLWWLLLDHLRRCCESGCKMRITIKNFVSKCEKIYEKLRTSLTWLWCF